MKSSMRIPNERSRKGAGTMTIMMNELDMSVHRRGASKSMPFYTSGFSLINGVGAGVFV